MSDRMDPDAPPRQPPPVLPPPRWVYAVYFGGLVGFVAAGLPALAALAGLCVRAFRFAAWG